MLLDYTHTYMNIYIIWQMFLACAAYSIMTR